MRLPTRYGVYGGMFVPEALVPALQETEAGFLDLRDKPGFVAELDDLARHYAGRPTPLYHARRLSKALGVELWLKREDLLHGGAHKTNNALGQGLLAKQLGKSRLIAETGAGQHGAATAMVGALLDLPTAIYMGARDAERQHQNVLRMRLCGAEVVPVTTGGQTLKDAINDALRDWLTHTDTTYYVFGTAAGPHPFPAIVRHFQSVIGREARAQCLERTGRLPDAAVACVGGGSNAIGLFSAFLADSDVALFGFEPAGEGLDTTRHGAPLARGEPGIFHGMRAALLQSPDGQIIETHSIAAGLDYPGVGPEHCHLRDTGRASYGAATDEEALRAFELLSRTEGIIPALESAHALAGVKQLVAEGRLAPGATVLVNLSGRGDKDLDQYAALGRATGEATDPAEENSPGGP